MKYTEVILFFREGLLVLSGLLFCIELVISILVGLINKFLLNLMFFFHDTSLITQRWFFDTKEFILIGLLSAGYLVWTSYKNSKLIMPGDAFFVLARMLLIIESMRFCLLTNLKLSFFISPAIPLALLLVFSVICFVSLLIESDQTEKPIDFPE